MKKKVTITLVLLVSVLSGVLVSINFKKKESSFKEKDSLETPSQIVGENTLSMMLETAYQSGNYDKTTQSSWPTDGYEFNPTLSKCENGGELSWDDENKMVSMTGNMSDKCYVYFDKLLTLAEYIKSQYTGSQGENNIYYHNGTITSGTTVIDAGDNSYRYAGASSSVKNYVCIGSTATTCPDTNLFRIIGVFDGKVKVIKATSIGTYAWDSNGEKTWSTSSLKTYLNGTYLSSISSFSSKIATTTWKVGGNYWSDIGYKAMYLIYQGEVTSSSSTTVDAKIGLMYVSDYGFAASPSAWTTGGTSYSSSSITSINWLYFGSDEWTVSRFAGNPDRETDSDPAYYVSSSGSVNYSVGGVKSTYAVRPVFYLNSSVTYVSGDGSSTLPVRVN